MKFEIKYRFRMVVIILFTASLLIGFMQTFGQITLIGKWRRINESQKFQDTISKQLRQSDIEIYSNSTFHIQGDSLSIKAIKPGWHTGVGYDGTWELNNNLLTLHINPKNEKIFLRFKILKLTKNKLILKSTFNEDEISVAYLRL